MKSLFFLLCFLPSIAFPSTGLTILTHCGKPIAFHGVLDGIAIFATPDDIENTPTVDEFFTTLWGKLPRSEGRPMVEELKAEILSGIPCPKFS